MVGHEEGVETAALQRLRKTLEMREIEVGVRESTGVTPGSGVNGGRAHESAEPQATLRGHGISVPALIRMPPRRGNRFARGVIDKIRRMAKACSNGD